MDSSPANKRFAEDIAVKFPLLSDWRRKAVKDYGVYNEESGYGTRATFVIDESGIIKHIEEGRSAVDPTGAFAACNLFDKKKTD
jgi:peroxiredoxin